MKYKIIDSKDLSFFKFILSENCVLTESEDLNTYSRDYTEDLQFLPSAVLVPSNAEQISSIMKYCHEHTITVTARGAGTGLSGGCLPVEAGVVLALHKLNKIIHIDENNFQAIVEPGVINEVFQEAVQALGLFYPPDPASKGSCTLGGNVAHSSGGPRCVKYGTTRDYVLNLEVVLAKGEIIQTGANVLKNSTGYNLTQLMVGSEGTLGIITKITLKLLSYPPYRTLMLASFASAKNACACVSKILSAGVTPSALEFMDKKGVEISTSKQNINFKFGDEKAYLLIEVDAFEIEDLLPQCEKIYNALDQMEVMNVLMAEDAETKEKFWKIRRSIGELVKQISIYKEEDTVVTRSYLPQLYEGVEYLSKQYGFETVCYGHAGDGNLHINILKNNLSDEFWQNELPKAIRKIFELCKQYGGTISGEHGIGLVQKQYLDVVFSPIHFELMKGIKKAFDPKSILNPKKIFDI